MRTIRVTGKGTLKVAPDTIRFRITQSEVAKTYDEAVMLSDKGNNELMSVVEKCGFDRKSLKTTHFSIDTQYESYQAKDKSWQQRFVGYRFNHRMKFEMPLNSKMLSRFFKKVSEYEIKPEINIQYTVADIEKCKNELLEKAISDSMEKATVLSRAAGLTLGDIQTIDYSWGEVDFYTQDSNFDGLMMAKCVETNGMDFQPDDIETSDTLTVVWEVK